jgi:aryl-alcohol dehydrogenase-like predicted oxidoreductase
MMTKKPLGRSGLAIAPLALGGNVFGWTIYEPTSFQVLDAFVDFGFDLIDTANMYSAWVPGHQGGESETIIGNWLRSTGKRDKIVLATKVGMPMGDGSKRLKERKKYEESLEPLCLEQGLGVIGYFSLASGFLTGKYRSREDLGKSARGAGIRMKYLNDRGRRILAALDEVSAAHQTAPAVIALAWLMQRQSVTAPIASATSVDQLSELVKAAEITLTRGQVALLNQASGE